MTTRKCAEIGLPWWLSGKESACQCRSESEVAQFNARDEGFLGREDPLEEEMATHSRILAWRIPWAEGPGGLQPMGSKMSQT